MPSTPQTPQHHYAESVRLLGVAEDAAIDPGIRDLAARMATAHAVLTLSGRRARRAKAKSDVARPISPGGSPRHRWLYGDDGDGQ